MVPHSEQNKAEAESSSKSLPLYWNRKTSWVPNYPLILWWHGMSLSKPVLFFMEIIPSRTTSFIRFLNYKAWLLLMFPVLSKIKHSFKHGYKKVKASTTSTFIARHLHPLTSTACFVQSASIECGTPQKECSLCCSTGRESPPFCSRR